MAGTQKKWTGGKFVSWTERKPERTTLKLDHLEERIGPAILATGAPAWISTGPGPISGNALGFPIYQSTLDTPIDQRTGAVEDIVPHPSDPNILFAGGVNGGVWRTLNGTEPNPTWVPLTDQLPSISVGAMDINPANPNKLLVGYGNFSSALVSGDLLGAFYTTNALDPTPTWRVLADPQLINQTVYGVIARDNYLLVAGTNGVFRSKDDGQTWTTLSGTGGLPTGAGANTTFLSAEADASNPNRVYVGSNAGIFRTEDITATNPNWTNVTVPTMNVSGATVQFKVSVHSSPGNNIVWAAVVNNNQVNNVHWSSNFGATWTQMDLPRIPNTPEPIANASNASPIVITSPGHGITPVGAQFEVFISGVQGNNAANGTWIATVVDQDTFSLNGSMGSGTAIANTGTWQFLSNINNGSQGYIHFGFKASPTNPNLVYISGDAMPDNNFNAAIFSGPIFRGDRTVPRSFGFLALPQQWAPISGDGTKSATAPYPDTRDIRFDANGTLFLATDGGVYRLNLPETKTGDWTAAIGNLSLGQLYQVRYDTINNVTFGGMQDTASPYQSSSGSNSWVSVIGGDGFWQGVDNESQAKNGLSLRYSMSNTVNSFFRLTFGKGNKLVSQKIVQMSDKVGGALYAGLDAADKGRFGLNTFTINAIDGRQLMLAMSNLYEDNDPSNGLAGDVIAKVTPSGYKGLGTAIAYGGKEGGIGIPRIAYVGTDAGQLWIRGAVGGMTQSKTLPGAGPISDISLDPDNWRRAYILRGNNVYFTEDAGATYTDITANLVATKVNGTFFDSAGNLLKGLTTELRSLAIYDLNPGVNDGKNVVIIGGNNGVFRYTPDLFDPTCTQGPWMRFGSVLPNVLIDDLQVYGNRLIAGTQGRGAWEIADISQDINAKAIITVQGDEKANNMSIVADPSNPNVIIVDDGLGNTKSFQRSAVQGFLIQGLGGADTITIAGSSSANGGLNFINFPIEIQAGGNVGDTLIVRDGARATPTRVTITNNQIGGGTSATSGTDDNFLSNTCGTSLTYSGLDQGTLLVDLSASTGGSTVLVQSTSAATTRIVGGKAANNVFLDSNAGLSNDGNMTAIQGNVIVDGQSNADALTLGATSLQAGNQNVVIGPNTVTGMLGQFTSGTVTYNNIKTLNIAGSNSVFNPEVYTIISPSANLNLFANAGPDTINIRSTTNAVDLDAGFGDDLIRVSSNAGLDDDGELAGILGSLIVEGGPGANRLVLSNFGSMTPGAYQISKTTISGGTITPISYFSSGGSFTSSDKVGIWLRGSNVANDTFTVDGLDGVQQLAVDGNGGDDVFGLNAQVVQGSVWFRGGAGDDLFRFNGQTIGNQTASLTFSGGGGNDIAQIQGFTGNDNANIRLLNSQAGIVGGLGRDFNFDTLAKINYNGITGRNNLTISNVSGTTLGTLGDPTSGVVYEGTNGEGGNLSFAQGKFGPTISFSNINGSDAAGLVYNGNAGRDTLTVLGLNTVGLPINGVGPLQGLSVQNGSDTIYVSDQLVTIRNATLGYIRPIAIAQVNGRPSISNLVLLGGNEPQRLGDNFTVKPSSNLNILVDGQGPFTRPGDTLTLESTEQSQLTSTFDPNLGRNVSQVITTSGATLSFQGFENTGLVGNFFAIGADVGGGPRVVVYDAATKKPVFDQFVYAPTFTGGVRVAMGDVTGDGVPDLVTVAGIGGGPHVQVYDGLTFNRISSFFAYESSFRGGLYVAVGDVNGDGKAEIVTGTGVGGGPLVRVFDQNGSVLTGFFAYGSSFRGGVRIAVGDVNGDGIADITTGAGPGGGPHIRVFSGLDLTVLANYLSGDSASSSGVFVAAGDLDGDGAAEIASAPGGNDAPVVQIRRLRDGSMLNLSVFDIGIIASEDSLPPAPVNVLSAQGGTVDENAGVRLAIGPFDGTGKNNLIVSRGAGYVPRVRAYSIDPLQEVGNFLPFEASFEGGVFVG